MESNKAEIHLESVSLKRNKITGHSRSPCKRLRHEETLTELKGSDKLSHLCSNNNKRIAPEPTAKTLHVSDECIQRVAGTLKYESKDEASSGHLERLSSSFRDNGVIIMENDSSIDHTLKDNYVDRHLDGGSFKRLTGMGSREVLNDGERLPTNCSASKNKDTPEPETSTILGRLQDAALNSEGGKNETLFAKDDNYGLLWTCITCSEEKRISYNSQENELCSCDATVHIKLDGSSAWKKFASMEEGARSEINTIVKQLLINCKKRMDKLIQKQQQESKVFHRVWEEKKFRVETDHKLEADMIRYIYNEGSAKAEKLKTLDSNYGKIMEQNNLHKKAELKDLETRQLAARNVLKEKQHNWLAKAKAICNREQASQSDEVGKCGCVNLTAAEGRVCDEVLSVELNQEDPTEVPGITDYVDPVELNIASDKQMNQRVEADGTSTAGLPLAGQILEAIEEASFSLPPVPEDQICGRLVSDDLEDTNAPVLEGGSLQMRNASAKLADAVAPVQPCVEAQTIINCEQLPFGSNDETPSSNLSPAIELDCQSHESHDSGRNLSQTALSAEALMLTQESSPQMEEVLEIQNNHIDIRSGPQDQMLESLASANLQDGDALLQVCQGTEQNVVSASELVGTVLSHSEAQTIENYNPLHIASTDESSSCNPPAIEVERPSCDSDSVRNSSENAQSAETLTFLHESSQVERDSETQSNCTDMGSFSRFDHDSSADLSTPSPNNVAMSHVAVGFAEVANPCILQLRIDTDNVHGSSIVLHPNNPSNTHFVIAHPLDNELERIVKETNCLKQSCKDKVSLLKSDYEKEIQEIIVQTQSKYDMRRKAAEADFTSKKKDHQKNQNKVFVNKVLADAFRVHTASPSMLQGATSRLPRQQLHQRVLQELLRLPPQLSACQPPPRLGVSHSTLHPGQHLLVPGFTNRLTCQNIAAPEQAMQHAVSLHAISTSRPPINSAGNLGQVGQNFSPGPHSCAFQPAGASSIRPPILLGISPSNLVQLQSSCPLHPLPLAMPLQPAPWPAPLLPYQNHAATGERLTALRNPSLSALDLPVDIDNEPPLAPWNHTSSLPDIGSTFGPLDSSYLESLHDV